MAEPRIIIDHLLGARRGRRQVFEIGQTVRFGRHPDSDVHFHAHRDLDASSRHAELGVREGDHVLRDVGSSNGTYVNGEKVAQVMLAMGDSVVVEFGQGGPRVRVYVGDPETLPPTPLVSSEWEPLSAGYRWTLVGIAAVIVGSAVAAWLMFV
jgi:pSer/pThr/pTyr-binding forkhead associated (FHA) protein